MLGRLLLWAFTFFAVNNARQINRLPTETPRRFSVGFDVAPDESAVLYNTPSGEIVSRSLATGETRRIDTGGYKVSGPSFAPDGKSFVGVVAGENCSHKILLVPLEEGGEAYLLTTTEGVSDTLPSFSPDGETVVLVRAHTLKELGRWPWKDYDVCTVRRDGTDLRRVTNGHYHGLYCARFLTDTEILFTVSTRDEGRIQRLDLATGDISPWYTPPPRPKQERNNASGIMDSITTTQIATSRDGNRIAFQSDKDRNWFYDIYWLDRTNSPEPRALGLSERTRHIEDFVLSKDGKTLYYQIASDRKRAEADLYDLWKVSLEDNRHQLVLAAEVMREM